MPNIKTAISIEQPIFEQMDVLAKNLKDRFFQILQGIKLLTEPIEVG